MSLKNRKAATRPITLSDGEDIAVRGLSLNMISEIILVHREAAIAMFATVMDEAAKPDIESMAVVAESIVVKFPTVIAHIIAVGTMDPDAYKEAADLPFGDQVVLIQEIGSMTFTTNGGMGKVFEAVISMLKGVNQSALKSIPTPTK